MQAFGVPDSICPSQGATIADPGRVLREVFGYPAFRGLQLPVIETVLRGQDALVLMPTGGGKSLCYQIPALCRPGLGLVVSPLIALMEDQVQSLRQFGVRAAALHSELDPDTARQIWRHIAAGTLDLLYVSPERLLAGNLLDRLADQPVALVAIDEAHCVSQWGHEFRPDYRALACLKSRLPGVPRLALTATADARTSRDMLAGLAMPDAQVFTASFHRPNLFIEAEPKTGETAQLLGFLSRHQGETGIIYCGTRARTERVAARLRREPGIEAIAYHAGLDVAAKRAALARFRSGDAVVMVATIAFGMGIDRPDVRYVIHTDMPDSPEAYYQQIGRAGRDGLPATALLLHGGEDIARARHFLTQSSAPDAQLAAMRERLEAMIAFTETPECRTARLLACFGEALAEPCGHCDTCQTPPVLFDGTEAARMVLSAAYRTGQMFGAVHLVHVLRGETNDMVRRHGHDTLPLFGIGRDRPATFWRGVIRQLIAHGALDTGTERLARLTLVPEIARPILRGEATLRLRVENSAPQPTRTTTPATSAAPVEAPSPALLARLKALRANLAQAQRVPAYVIFHDSVLLEIAARRPASLDALATIKGIGTSKQQRYGAALLACVAEQDAAAGSPHGPAPT